MKNDVILYSVSKTKDKDFYISVQNGEVVIEAPWYYTNSIIRKNIECKKEWILKKIKEYNLSKEQEISLRPVQILGVIYDLKIVFKNVKVIDCDLAGSELKVSLPKKYKNMDKENLTDLILDKLYMKIAENEIENYMEKTRVLLGFAPEDYKVVYMNDCIAKCTEDKKILINPRIFKYDRKTVEYIILHEFCHLKYKKHTKFFYKYIEKYMPNYKEFELKNVKY